MYWVNIRSEKPSEKLFFSAVFSKLGCNFYNLLFADYIFMFCSFWSSCRKWRTVHTSTGEIWRQLCLQGWPRFGNSIFKIFCVYKGINCTLQKFGKNYLHKDMSFFNDTVISLFLNYIKLMISCALAMTVLNGNK